MRLFSSLLLVVVVGASALVACSSSSDTTETGCAANPFSCAAGTTCSAKDGSGVSACLPSGAGTRGSACQNTPGVATCGDTLLCLQQSAAGGRCTAYCEAGSTARGCQPGEQCRAAAIQGTTTVFYVCAGGVAPPEDSGAPDSGAADASGE